MMSNLPAGLIVLSLSLALRTTMKPPHVCVQVTLAALELANALVGNDTASLEAGCLLGLVPAVLRYAFPSQPLPLRMQAAAFAAALCHASTATARMFVACQVSCSRAW